MPIIASLKVYVVVGVLAMVNGLWLAVSRIELFWLSLIPLCVVIALLAVTIWVVSRIQARRHDESWFAVGYAALQGLLFLNISWINLRILNHLGMTMALPYQDDLLKGWDKAIGIEWLQYFELVHESPILIGLLDTSYTSLTPLSVLVLLSLIATSQFRRARFFLEAFFFTALLCIVIGSFFPAEAAVATTIPDLNLYPNFSKAPGIYHIEHMKRLRATEGSIVLYPNILPGLVTFPSLHTAAGIILVGTFWRSKGFPLVLGYSLVMIAATPVFGGHYIVDLMAGTVLALSVMAVLIATPQHSSVFSGNAGQLWHE